MAEHNQTGVLGEQLAAAYLQEKGYIIRHTNWRSNHKEIDIVAENEQYIVIVEVKTRHSTFFGLPEEAVTRQKQRFLVRAANDYVLQYDCQKDVRFDIISIVLTNGQPQITHIEDAFSVIGLW